MQHHGIHHHLRGCDDEEAALSSSPRQQSVADAVNFGYPSGDDEPEIPFIDETTSNEINQHVSSGYGGGGGGFVSLMINFLLLSITHSTQRLLIKKEE